MQMLEAPLLADEKALKGAVGISAHYPSPEKIANPKHELTAALSRANRDYTPAVARKIAELASVDVIARKCPSFKRLKDAIAAF